MRPSLPKKKGGGDKCACAQACCQKPADRSHVTRLHDRTPRGLFRRFQAPGDAKSILEVAPRGLRGVVGWWPATPAPWASKRRREMKVNSTPSSRPDLQVLCQLFISNTHFLDRQAEPQRPKEEKKKNFPSREAHGPSHHPAGRPRGLRLALRSAWGTLRAAPNQGGPPSPKAPASIPPPGTLSQDQTAAAGKPRRTPGGSLGAELAAPAPVPSGTLLGHVWPPASRDGPSAAPGRNPRSRDEWLRKVLRRLLVQPCAMAPGTLRRARLRAAVTGPGVGSVPGGLRI